MHSSTHTQPASSPIRAAAPGGADAAPRPSWIARFWTAGSDKRIKQIQTLRDDGTSADEILVVARDWLLPISLVFSSVFCFLFYHKYLGEAFPPAAAIGGAVVIALLIECGKVWFGIRALRFLYFENPLSSVANTILFVAVLGFACLAFYWSFSNSTSGLHDMSSSIAWERNRSEFAVNTTDIDRQISDARAAQQRAGQIKWRGTVTIDAQRTIRKQEENISRLQEQRAAMISQAKADHDARVAHQGEATAKAAGWTRLVGGLIEGVQILLLFIAASCEKILGDRSADAKKSGRSSSPTPPAMHGQPQATPHANGQPYNWIGFNRGADGNVTPAARHENPVSQPPPPVSQFDPAEPMFLVADEILRYYEGELRKEPSHFQRRDANAPTIVNRIHKKLRLAHSAIDRTRAGAFTFAAAQRFGLYLTGVIRPLLEQHAPYEGLDDMLSSLRHKTATEGEAVIR